MYYSYLTRVIYNFIKIYGLFLNSVIYRKRNFFLWHWAVMCIPLFDRKVFGFPLPKVASYAFFFYCCSTRPSSSFDMDVVEIRGIYIMPYTIQKNIITTSHIYLTYSHGYRHLLYVTYCDWFQDVTVKLISYC